MFKLLLPLLLFLGVHAEMVDGVAVVVEDAPITLYDIQKEMRTTRVDKKTAIDILIRKKLEEQQIKKRGLRVSEDER